MSGCAINSADIILAYSPCGWPIALTPSRVIGENALYFSPANCAGTGVYNSSRDYVKHYIFISSSRRLHTVIYFVTIPSCRSTVFPNVCCLPSSLIPKCIRSMVSVLWVCGCCYVRVCMCLPLRLTFL